MTIPTTTNVVSMRDFGRGALRDALRHAGASDEALQRLRRKFAELDDVQRQIRDVLDASYTNEAVRAAKDFYYDSFVDDSVFDEIEQEYQDELDQLGSVEDGIEDALREQVRDIMAGLGADGAVEAMGHVLRAYVDLYGRETGLKPPQIRWEPMEETDAEKGQQHD